VRARLAVVALAALAACGGGSGSDEAATTTTTTAGTTTSTATAMTLTTDGFADGAAIPVRFTCDGANEKPALEWSGEPPETKAIAITVVDSDAHDFEHWVRVGDVDGVPWRGPCPPKGSAPHHYVFTVHALDASDVAADRAAIDDHTIASATITGTYQRAGS
jgi:phosphatidylethanolamine-binding protein (PEBP) family uncharacterized protein